MYPLPGLSSPRTHAHTFGGPKLPGNWNYYLNEVVGDCVAPFLGKVDVYHPTLYRIMPGVRARRIVATHHDCTQEKFPQQFRYAGKVMQAKKSQYAAADAIICVSEFCRKELLEIYGINSSKTQVIYHGLTQLPLNANASARIRQQVRREYLLYVGSRPRYKNFGGLLTAYYETALHRQYDLLAVGGGPLNEDEQQTIRKFGLTDYVSVIAAAPDDLLAAAYAGAKLFIYPSFSEGFGLPPLEAMSLNCPVLASRVSSIPEICGDAPFYFDPEDQASFNRELLRAVDDDEECQRAVRRGREVISRYSWEKCGQQTLDVYRSC